MTEREAINFLLKTVHRTALESIDEHSRQRAYAILEGFGHSYLRDGGKVLHNRIKQMADDGLLVVYDYRYDKETVGKEDKAIYRLIVAGPLDTYALWIITDDAQDDFQVWSIDGAA
ncbi:MAG: hypothetical protein KO464_02345 [Candidatus Methanofastidiosum sp.]|jgi:hypothetical protein|nr:hypothetical protein [Methanofastidiosum sp.]